MWPSMWLTPMRGSRRAKARALAAEMPTKRDPTSPGPWVTATASTSARVTPACRRAWSMTGKISSTWRREAISGTTPPNRWWSSIWDAITLERMRLPPSTTAAAVSSQLVSMPRIKSSPNASQVLPHDDRILVVVPVIALADAGADEAQVLIQPLGDHVGHPHFQGHAPRRAGAAQVRRGLQQPAADAPLAVVGMHRHVGDVPLAGDDPHPDVAHHPRAVVGLQAGHQVMGAVVVQQLRHKRSPGPRRGKRAPLDLHHRVHVADGHRFDHDGERCFAAHFRSASDSRRYKGTRLAGSSRRPCRNRNAPSAATAPLRSVRNPTGGRWARGPKRWSTVSQCTSAPSPMKIIRSWPVARFSTSSSHSCNARNWAPTSGTGLSPSRR